LFITITISIHITNPGIPHGTHPGTHLGTHLGILRGRDTIGALDSDLPLRTTPGVRIACIHGEDGDIHGGDILGGYIHTTVLVVITEGTMVAEPMTL
jgi:hypothetical protein